MIIVQLFQYLLHDSLAEKHRLYPHTKLITILINGSHLAVIQVDNLTMATHQRRLLFLEVFWIYGCRRFLFSGHRRKRY